jgi:hypothetical protein
MPILAVDRVIAVPRSCLVPWVFDLDLREGLSRSPDLKQRKGKGVVFDQGHLEAFS